MRMSACSVLVLSISLSAVSMPLCAMPNSFFSPFAGIDLGYKTHKFKENLGSNVFQKDHPEGSFYVGAKLGENLGVEIGTETSVVKTSDVSLRSGDVMLGVLIQPAIDPIVLSSKSKFSGWHIGLVGNYPIKPRISVIGSIGIKRASVKLESDILSVNNVPANPVVTLSLKQTKTIGRLSGGVEYSISEHVSARALATWENYAKFNLTGNTSTGGYREAKLRNAVGYYVGLVVRK